VRIGSRDPDVTLRASSTNDLSALSRLAPELAETFVTLASDIALVLDSSGTIRKVALGTDAPLTPDAGTWVGRAWVDTVTGDTRGKIEALLREVAATGSSRRSEVNHPSPSGIDIPVAYAAIRLGADGPVLAVGRDLRAIAAIQQQFVDAQQEIEREYWKQRQAESHYRLLFQVATDAVLVADAESFKILDANRAANELFDLSPDQLIGLTAIAAIDRASRPAVTELLETARASGLPGEVRAALSGRRLSVRISATPFRSADAMLLLIRARAAESRPDEDEARAALVGLVERTPDAVVVTDIAGRILMANPSFVELAQATDQNRLKGRPLTDFVGVELTPILAATRAHGIAVGHALSLRGARDRVLDIEVSAALLPYEDREHIGLTMRVNERAPAAPGPESDRGLAAAIEHLTMQVGHRDLPALMAELSRLAERHFIDSALARVEGDAAGAARLLRISPASLDQRRQACKDASGSGDGEAGGNPG
jgi:transcriptional regulator PpsR